MKNRLHHPLITLMMVICFCRPAHSNTATGHVYMAEFEALPKENVTVGLYETKPGYPVRVRAKDGKLQIGHYVPQISPNIYYTNDENKMIEVVNPDFKELEVTAFAPRPDSVSWIYCERDECPTHRAVLTYASEVNGQRQIFCRAFGGPDAVRLYMGRRLIGGGKPSTPGCHIPIRWLGTDPISHFATHVVPYYEIMVQTLNGKIKNGMWAR